MKKYFLLFIGILISVYSHSQDYEITFEAYGESSYVDSVVVQNLNQDTYLTIPGDATLHLLGNLTNVISSGRIEPSFQIYPNPMYESAVLELYTESESILNVSIFDIAGKLILNYNTNSVKGRNDFEIGGLKSGVYNVVMTTNDWSTTGQLVAIGSTICEPRVNVLSQEVISVDKMKKLMSESVYQMQYNDGDLLIFTGYVDENSTISTLIPTESQSVLQNIVSCTDPDGYSYSTVTIENQVWMAENLRYLPFVNQHVENSADMPHQYVYEYEGNDVTAAKNTENYENYGVLYNWNSAISSCPDGWHLPSNQDWSELERAICNSETCETDFPFETNIGIGECGTNEGSMLAGIEELWADDFMDNDLAESSVFSTSGFMALAGGQSYIINEGFNGLRIHGFYWASDIKGATGLIRSFYSYETNIRRNFYYMSSGFSVRCVRDVSEDVYLPTVCTQVVTSLSDNSATSGGVTTDLGNDDISSQGIVWGVTPDPTIEDHIGISDEGNENGDFVSEMIGLNEMTTYYVRAYAINSSGVGYGESISFETFSVLDDGMGEPCDGVETVLYEDYIYNTIELGGRCWFAENLRYLPFVNELDDLSDESPKYYVYDYDGTSLSVAINTEEYQTYGVLYNWFAATTACPEGWSLPTIKDWRLLTRSVCISGDCEADFPLDGEINDIYGSYEGSRLAGGYDYWLHHNLTENSEFGTSGFDFLPVGWVGETDEGFDGSHNFGFEGYAWCKEQENEPEEIWKYVVKIDFQRTLPYWSSLWSWDGTQVRCVMKQAPYVETDSVYGIDQNYVLSGGFVVNNNGEPVTNKGVVWSETSFPNIEDNYINYTEDGTGEGGFESLVTGLEPSTIYYLRAYATNSVGTDYGEELIFTTNDVDIPVLETDSVNNITFVSADCFANLISTGGLELLNLGFVYSTNPSPIIEDNSGIIYSNSEVGGFSEHLTNLDYETIYYIRAFASNSLGTGYGNELSFETDVFFPFVNCGDDQFYGDYYYKTVLIGEQCWFAENLGYDNGCSSIELVDYTDVGHCTYIGDNQEEYGNLGLLYQSSVADTICPLGWHLPTKEEWIELEDYLAEGEEFWCDWNSYWTGKTLADSIGWSDYSYSCRVGNELSDNNATGFSIRPTSYYYTIGLTGESATFWTSTPSSSSWIEKNYSTGIEYDDTKMITPVLSYRYSEKSVRCLKTQAPIVETALINTIHETSAKSGGEVIDDGGQEVFARGCVWSLVPNPTIENNEGMTIDGDSLGSYISDLQFLIPETEYYYRAYANNNGETGYGEEYSFTSKSLNLPCLGMETVDYEGYTYNTIQIGAQCWLAENLKYLPEVVGEDSTSTESPFYYVYQYNGLDVTEAMATPNYDTYGVLYNWPAALTACPAGWGLPTHYEWTILERKLCSSGDCDNDFPYYDQDPIYGMTGNSEGSKLAGSDLWVEADLVNSFDFSISNFNALPGSGKDQNGYFVQYGGEKGYWWTSTNSNNGLPWYRSLNFLYSKITRDRANDRNAYSVRCVKTNDVNNLLPTVVSLGVVDVTPISVTVQYSVSYEGESTVTSRGIVWGSSPNLTYDIFDEIEIDGEGTGEFSIPLNMLPPSTTFYYRAFAANEEGIGYGDVIEFSTLDLPVPQACEGTPIVDYEGYSYNTVKIGNQCWFAENLRYLPAVSNSSQFSDIDLHYYVYGYEGNDVAEAKLVDNYDNYGVLYNWNAALNSQDSSTNNPSNRQGVCPDNWHIPSFDEFEELKDYLEDNGYDFEGVVGDNHIAKALCDTIFWDESDDDGEVGFDLSLNNSSGFSLVPAGRFEEGFSSSNYGGYLWSTETVASNTYAKALTVYKLHSQVGSLTKVKSEALSVRCIRDYELPQVSTELISDISTTTATGGGTVVSEGELPVNSRGLVWSRFNNPTILDNEGFSIDGSGLGEFSTQISHLESDALYYIRAYAICNADTVYGEEVSLETEAFQDCGTIDYQGYVYNTVQIGEQCWMAENLRYLPAVVSGYTGNSNTPYYYVSGYYGTDVTDAKATTAYENYGVMYNWLAAYMSCPPGWELPTHDDWTYLEREVSGLDVEACDTIFPYDNDASHSNFYNNVASQLADSSYLWEDGVLKSNYLFGASGFNALPGGKRDESNFFGESISTEFWSVSVSSNSSRYWYRFLSSQNSSIMRSNSYKSYGRYVRCVQPASEPIIETIEVTNVLDTSVNSGVRIISDGGAYVSSYGIVWDTVPNPTIENCLQNIEINSPASVENYIQISDLYPEHAIYIVTYATNKIATVYGNELSFTTSSNDIFSDCGDNMFYIDHYYKTVQIGDQCWFAENLKYLPFVSYTNVNSNADSHYYVYEYSGDDVTEAKNFEYQDENIYQTYGVLYNWTAAMNGDELVNLESNGVQGICPDGWVLPSDNAWSELEDYLFNNGFNCEGGYVEVSLAKSIADTCTWSFYPEDCTVGYYQTTNNSSGFSGKAAGKNGSSNLNVGSYWWTATESSDSSAILRVIGYSSSRVFNEVYNKSEGFSIRCLLEP